MRSPRVPMTGFEMLCRQQDHMERRVNTEMLIAGIVAVLLLVYLIYCLFRAEKL